MARQPTTAINGLWNAASAIHHVTAMTASAKAIRPGERRAAWVVQATVSAPSGAMEGSPLECEGEGAATAEGDGEEACIL
jgi:hypothetical protein